MERVMVQPRDLSVVAQGVSPMSLSWILPIILVIMTTKTASIRIYSTLVCPDSFT